MSRSWRAILRHAGVEVRIGSLLPEITAANRIWNCRAARRLRLEPLRREGNRLKVGDFDPCVVLLNNDLSARCAGNPAGPGAGRASAAARRLGDAPQVQSFRRLRRCCPRLRHAGRHRSVADQPLFREVRQDQFPASARAKNAWKDTLPKCLKTFARNTPSTASKDEPFVIVKADAGTYGMGIMTVKDAVRGQGSQPQAAQQDGRRQGRPGGAGRHRAGRRLLPLKPWVTRSPNRWFT